MTNLNDLIWNPEDDNSLAVTNSGGGENMDEVCMTGFCWDIAETMWACCADAPYRSSSCV